MTFIEQIIRDRLSVEERNLRRVTKKHSVLINSLEQGNIKDVQQQFNDFMVDFSSYELTLTRFQAIHDMNLQETRHWNEEAQRIELEIKETMLVIKDLETELAHEEEIRRNKTEYDQLATEINRQKTREESLSAIAKLDEEIISLEEQDRILDETLDRRRSQLQRILTVVQEVQSEIEIEREQNPQIIDEEEAVTTPDSMRSEFFSPIANPSSPAEHVNDNNNPPQINGINGINSSSNLADNDNESDHHRISNDNDENKQQNNEESSPQQQSQEIVSSTSDNLTEVGEDDVGEIGELAADETNEVENELEVRDDATEPDDVDTIDSSSDGADLNQNAEIEDLDDGDVVTSDNEKNTVKYDEENDDIPVPTDEGEIVEDSDETQRGEKRKRSDEEEDEEEDEEGLIKEKVPRLSDDDEGLIEESEEDEGVIIKDDE
ncbi:Tho complex subunit 7-domain-containing protein [Glomus cerebriforme]|uniref:Tho complex subunit 7-domain-containing protein n=1 Tax=Glomus cerebriforme TaxID=658196 RepID=A0A397TH87_9GLOM|nr:Tho complex subunit 7-domain-containing protein [Glomus cerebriforme]